MCLMVRDVCMSFPFDRVFLTSFAWGFRSTLSLLLYECNSKVNRCEKNPKEYELKADRDLAMQDLTKQTESIHCACLLRNN